MKGGEKMQPGREKIQTTTMCAGMYIHLNVKMFSSIF
jgi:hypothetical protein